MKSYNRQVVALPPNAHSHSPALPLFFLSLIYILPYDAVLFAAAHRRNALAQSHFQATAMIMPRVADMDFSRISYAH